MVNKTIKIVIILAIPCLLIFVVIPLMDTYGQSKIARYADLSLYIEDNYKTLSTNNLYGITSDNCKSYLPSYETFPYKENLNEFYVFNGTKSFLQKSISFVLELQFQNIAEYEEFLTYEYSRCDYDFDTTISHNDYECFITNNSELTYFYFEEDIPYQFGMLCRNEEELKIRYVYFRECELSIDDQFNIVFQNTNCEW